MPQNELLDRIFECFNRYNYWSMKALRAELQQPEAYLRETLEKIAVLAKNKIANYDAIGDAVAPTAEGEGQDESDMADEEDGEDDEDVKFEDVA
jgi:transcription initiation factor TFIIF subunit beta